MTDINLLPWREQKREREKKEFMTYLVIGLAFAVFTVFSIDYYANTLIDSQTQRNERLKKEITQLEAEIKEIKNLKLLKQQLIARMNIVQNLQATRTLTVRLLDEIIGIIPDGVYLYQISRVENKVTLLGYSESNTRISKLMRSIQGSVWTQDPSLTEIKRSDDTDRADNSEFKLSFVLKSKTMLGSPSLSKTS